MKKSLYVLLFFSATALIISCSKDLKVTTKPKLTPYSLVIPGDLKKSNFIVPADNPLTVEGVTLGRHLFYDPILSDDGTQSCSSCHHQENAFSDPKQFSVGIDGSTGNRNAMSLVNLGFQREFFWDGRTKTLEEQALMPIEDVREMKSTVAKAITKLKASAKYQDLFAKAYPNEGITPNTLAKAIASFERIIVSGESKYDKYVQGKATFTDEEELGFLFFSDTEPSTGGDCLHCHVIGSTFSDFFVRNNGLDVNFTDSGKYYATGNLNDIGKFKTPSLRNIALTAPYMHDGRFATLAQVMSHYNTGFKLNSPNLDPTMSEQVPGRLSTSKRNAIIAFLHTLTDSTLITNPDLSKP
jgi:cytochrome c peroxidase